MTKEELEKETAEYFKSICGDYNEEYEQTGKRHYWVGFDIKNAYLAGAESREKRIEELKKENAELKARINNLKDEFKYSENYGKRVQNERHRLVNDNAKLRDQLTKAKELIEDMYDKIPSNHSDYYKDVMERARQFISEVEK